MVLLLSWLGWYGCHLPGVVASLTTVPCMAVPVESKKLAGLDSLLSSHMPNEFR